MRGLARHTCSAYMLCPLPLQVEFKPLVQLDEVKTANGEEDEESVFKM